MGQSTNLSNSLSYLHVSQIDERALYVAQSGQGDLSVANPNLDGSGTLVTVYTPGANGALLKRVTINAIGSTTRGMIRLFVTQTSGDLLIAEIPVDNVVQNSIVPAFSFEGDFDFMLNGKLKASTEKAENFKIEVEVFEITYP